MVGGNTRAYFGVASLEKSHLTENLGVVQFKKRYDLIAFPLSIAFVFYRFLKILDKKYIYVYIREIRIIITYFLGMGGR